MMTVDETDTDKRLQHMECAPECDGVNLQCINSSDFIVGKQTTFNGPVTIINCLEEPRAEGSCKTSKEEIVIKEKIITPSVVAEMNAFAEKKHSEDGCAAGKSESRNVSFVRNLFRSNFLKIPLILWFLLVIVIVVGCAVFLTGNGVPVSGNSSERPDIVRRNPRTITYNGRNFNIISREEWYARTPMEVVEMKTPVHYVVISHTASRFCYTLTSCKILVRDIQADLMTRSVPYSDIAYSFMVGGDGNIYEGRGWKVRPAVSGFANAKNVNINFLGSFENLDAPTFPQIEAVKALIEYGVNNSYIEEDYALIAANSTYATLSPGIQVYKEIKTWPHFDPNPEDHVNE